MKIHATAVGLVLTALAATLAGCSSSLREPRKPTVGIVMSAAPGHRPSPEEVAAVHQVLQPLIERRGYALAKSSRTADYFVHVHHPFDPLSAGQIVFERAEPTVPFIRSHETDQERRTRESKNAIAEMVREPK